MSQEVRLERQGFTCCHVGPGSGYFGTNEADGPEVQVCNVPGELRGSGSAFSSC